MVVGLLASLIAALCYGVGSILESVGAKAALAGSGATSGSLARAFVQLPYLAGIGLDGVGFILSLVAFQFLPLFVVEAILASSVGVTAILAVRFLGATLKVLEKFALATLVGGLVLLGLSASKEATKALSDHGKLYLLGGVLVLVAGAALASTAKGHRGGLVFAVLAGLAFSGCGVASRTLVIPQHSADYIHLIGDPTIYSIAIYGILGLAFFAAALQRAPVTTVTAIVFAIQTVLPSLVGIILLGDRAREGFAPVALFAFTLAVVSAVVLALQSEPDAELEPVGA